MKSRKIQHFSIFTDEGPSTAERVVRTKQNFLRKPAFLNEIADWISELSSVINKYNNTIHHSIEKTPIEACKTSNKKVEADILEDNREIQKPKLTIGDLVRTADIKRNFSKGKSTNWS